MTARGSSPDAAGLVADGLEAAAFGDPWYGAAVHDLVADLTAAEAATTTDVASHSIWEILLHVIAWQDEVTRRLGGAEPRPPMPADWPDSGTPTEDRWDAARDLLRESTRRLAGALRSAGADQLGARVGASRDQSLGTGLSGAETAIGTVMHVAYHAGQIALVRRRLRG